MARHEKFNKKRHLPHLPDHINTTAQTRILYPSFRYFWKMQPHKENVLKVKGLDIWLQ